MNPSILNDNLYFIKTKDETYKNKNIRKINKEISGLCNIIYFSAIKL